MDDYKYLAILIFSILNISCDTTSKNEYGLLQIIEGEQRSNKFEFTHGKPKLIEKNGAWFIGTLSEDGNSIVWIMASPKSSPYYKQLPAELNYKISTSNYQKIRDGEICSDTVLSVLHSRCDQIK